MVERGHGLQFAILEGKSISNSFFLLYSASSLYECFSFVFVDGNLIRSWILNRIIATS